MTPTPRSASPSPKPEPVLTSVRIPDADIEGMQDVTEITEDRMANGYIRHRCFCRYRTVLGAHGFDESKRYCYKIVVKDRAVIIYFGAFVVVCKDCSRWHRVRLLPKENRVDISVMRSEKKD